VTKKIQLEQVAHPTPGTIVATAKPLLLAKTADGTGLPYDHILVAIRAAHPGCRTKVNSLRWYETGLRGIGLEVPRR
jgi:hypothetical protein